MRMVSKVHSRWLRVRNTACAALIVPSCLEAQAQALMEEVVVTAQKREQSIQDVGISITAFTGNQLSELGFQNSFDIAAMTPGVHISGNNGGQKTLFTIRGVTQNDFNDHTESPVAVYVDEGYVGFGQGQVFGLYDLDRVEILKGPQGTLFGRNATGGLVHFLSKRPTREVDGFLDTTVGNYDHVRVEGAVGGPLTDRLSGRFAVLYNAFDPIIDNDYPERAVTLSGNPLESDRADTGDEDTRAIRAQLLFEPSDTVSALLIGSYAETQQSTSPFLELPTVPVFDAAGNHVNAIVAGPNETREAILDDGTPIDHPLSFDADLVRPPGGNLYGPSCTRQDYEDLECAQDFAYEDANTTDTLSLTGKITWQMGESTTLTSISDYKHYDKFQALAADGGPASTVNVMFDGKSETFSEELRINGETDNTRWVTGLYYLNMEVDFNVSLPAEPDSLFEPLAGVPWEDAALTELETDSWSVFGQVEYDFSSTLTGIVGLRAIHEEKDFTGEETFFLNTDPLHLDTETVLFNVQPRRNHNDSDLLWSGKLQLEWRPREDLLLYAGINRGVKAGGFNAPFTFGAGFPPEDIPYKDETLLAYEAGLKWSDLLGGTSRLNASVYYYDYADYQGFFFTQVTGYVRNVDARSQGIELEFYSSPLPGLDLSLSFSYIDPEVYDVQLGPGVFIDAVPSFTPDKQAAALVRYEWSEAVLRGLVSVQATANYSADFYDNIRNFDASRMPSYTVANLRAGWRSLGGQWEGAVFVNNVADERYFTIGYDLSNSTGSNSLVPGKPRWDGLSVTYRL